VTAIAQAPVRSGFRALRVTAVDSLCDDAVAITFAVPADVSASFDFKPGQSLTVRRIVDGREERRSYSICSAAGSAPRIGVREVPRGEVSGWLVHDLRVGDELEVQPPTGTFTPDLTVPSHHLLIAAGSGITPVLSIAASVLAANRSSQVTLVYGNRRADSVMFADEVADLKDAYPSRLRLVHVLSREPQEVDLFSGRLDADRLRALLPQVCPIDQVGHAWLCGPYGMVTDAIEVLGELGIADEHIHRELFYVEDSPPEQEHHIEAPPGPGSQVTVILDGRSTSTIVPGDVPLLDGLQKVRPDLPFACKGGVCGTCRAKVIDGQVHMRRNFALEPHEVDAGFVLTCQSLCTSDVVTVDFDA